MTKEEKFTFKLIKNKIRLNTLTLGNNLENILIDMSYYLSLSIRNTFSKMFKLKWPSISLFIKLS